MSLITLVRSPEDAMANIINFNEYVRSSPHQKMRKVLSHARAWYVIQDGDTYFYAPSKFIAYSNMTDDLYVEESGNEGKLDGRVTERLLEQWTVQVQETDPQYEELHEGLAYFCAAYGAFPNKGARISVFRDIAKKESITEADQVKALSVLIASLSPEARKDLKRLAFA